MTPPNNLTQTKSNDLKYLTYRDIFAPNPNNEQEYSMRGPNLYVQTTQTINDRLGYINYGNGNIPLNQYITDSGIKDQEILNKIKGRLHNYRHRNNHKRAALTQKEIAFTDQQIKLAKPKFTPIGPEYLDKISNQETPKQTYDLTTYNLITITDHLELLIGKTIKHETFPIEGTIININNEIVEIDFNGKIVEIELTETNGLLIQVSN